ncbi:hypothetical protein NKH77_42970 [Streptomyces sp. M19]
MALAQPDPATPARGRGGLLAGPALPRRRREPPGEVGPYAGVRARGPGRGDRAPRPGRLARAPDPTAARRATAATGPTSPAAR